MSQNNITQSKFLSCSILYDFVIYTALSTKSLIHHKVIKVAFQHCRHMTSLWVHFLRKNCHHKNVILVNRNHVRLSRETKCPFEIRIEDKEKNKNIKHFQNKAFGQLFTELYSNCQSERLKNE